MADTAEFSQSLQDGTCDPAVPTPECQDTLRRLYAVYGCVGSCQDEVTAAFAASERCGAVSQAQCNTTPSGVCNVVAGSGSDSGIQSGGSGSATTTGTLVAIAAAAAAFVLQAAL